MSYDYYHIEDIGKYKCSNKKCNFVMPKPKYVINDFNNGVITIDKKYKITLSNDMLYNLNKKQF